MTPQQYFPLLEGLILLVDPFSFPAVQQREGAPDYAVSPLQDVVRVIVTWIASGRSSGPGAKLPLRVAVVLSKADLASVREQFGDLARGSIAGQTCREALAKWGGAAVIRDLELRFAAVEYFACAPLGRAPDPRSREPFHGRGVLEPLEWLLTGERRS
jgi:hypothetical protein